MDKPRSRAGHSFGALVCATAFAISLAAAALALWGFGGRRWSSVSAFAQESEQIAGAQAAADQAAVVDFSEAARVEAASPRSGAAQRSLRSFHRPLPRPYPGGDGAEQVRPGEQAPSAVNHRHATHGAEVSFGGTNDNGSVIPPDTMGAVGPNHVVETLNSQVQIFTRAGSVLSSVSLTGFWSGLSIREAFDPRITFDPFNGRWIFAAGADPAAATSAILVGVSQTSDPTGKWNLYKVDADPTGTLWVDFPTLGFNKSWIAVQANLFTVSGSSFAHSNLYLFNKADLYAAGAGSYTVIQETSGFTDFPVTTYDNTLDTLYLAESWSGGQGTLRISTVSGPIGFEVLSPGVAFPQGSQAWQSFSPTTNFAPQAGSTKKIDTDDDRLITSVYRNGALWASQTVYLPASTTPTRTAAQWWEVDLTAGHLGNVLQFGRVDDPCQQSCESPPLIII